MEGYLTEEQLSGKVFGSRLTDGRLQMTKKLNDR